MIGERRSTPAEHERLGTEPIDGLRGVAIVMVIFYHTWLLSWFDPSIVVSGRRLGLYPIVRPGFLGVDVFFVVSAFCLTYPYALAHVRGLVPPSLRGFAWRRAIKIVPSYALVLAATIASALALHSISRGELPGLLWQHALFVQNATYDRLGAENAVLWSLAVEVQFYVLFPALVWLFVRSPWLVTAGLVALAQIHRRLEAGCCLNDEDVMRLLPAYLDLFALGMLAAWLVVVIPERAPALARRRWLFTLLGVGGAVGMLYLLVWLDVRYYVKDARGWFDVTQRSVFGLAIAVFAVGSCLGVRPWRRIVGNPALAWLSLVSYNLYLWHTLVELFFYHHHIPHARTREPHLDDAWKVPYIALSFATFGAIATAVTYFVERPLLGLVKPQAFAFPYVALVRRAIGSRSPSPAPVARAAPLPRGTDAAPPRPAAVARTTDAPGTVIDATFRDISGRPS